ncbi:MAG TPA: hypothetical protein DHW49_13630 [Anaerolineae bacterium]|nr:hypothetical protein [Anaerolineae bacterium]
MIMKNTLTKLGVMLVILIGLFGGYLWGRATTENEEPTVYDYPPLPPLTQLDIPSQTINGITADIESYYADGLRLIFIVRLTGENNAYYWENLFLTDSLNQLINAGYGFGVLGDDQSLYTIDMVFETPLQVEQFQGVLSFSVAPMMPEFSVSDSSNFEFNIDLPIKSFEILDLNQTVEANGVTMLLEKMIISPAFTKIYLCYNKPTNADWGIGGIRGDGTELSTGSQSGIMNSYLLLFDSELGDMGKSAEPDWIPPIQDGRCVKIGFPIGDETPQSIQLKVFNLERSMPEAIPEDELAIAREKLLEQGIDMDWQIIAYPEGGGSSGPVYNKLPEGMSEEEAYQKFIEALGYIHHGPWEFTITP